MKTNEEFFDSISSFYDKMINFDAAIQRRKEGLANFIERGMEKAADFGSGTGLDSIALALQGLSVTGFDISRSMIEQAEINSRIYNTDIQFVQAELDRIPDNYRGRFDLIVAMGNTFANLNPSGIKEAASKAYGILRDKGKLLLQILNFKKIKSLNERIINITGKDNYYYVRFYDFFEDDINFNILKFNMEDPSKRELVTTRLYIYTPEALSEILTAAGFRDISYYETLSGKEFQPESSRDIIIQALK